MTQAINIFKGFHDLSYSFARLGGAVGAGTQQDWVGLGANLGAAIGKFGWYARDKIDFLVKGLKVEGITPTPTAIIDVAMVVVTILDLLNGVWPPDKGDRFLLGKSEFENMQHFLEAADPDPAKWSGTGAAAYKAQNDILLQLTKDLQGYDKEFADLLKAHATRVQKMHTDYAIMLMVLVAAQLTSMVIWSLPALGGPVASFKFQVLTVLAMALTIMSLQGDVCSASQDKASKISELGTKYTTAGASAEAVATSGTFAKIASTGAQETSVSSFEAISASMSGAPPSFATLANIAKTDPSIEEHPLLSSFTGDGAAAGEGAFGAADAAAAPAATPPAVTPPSVTQAAQVSGPLAAMSGRQQGQGAAAPAKKPAAQEAAPEEAALVGAAPAEAEPGGAGVGTEGAQRAPVGAGAAGTEQAQQPTPAERPA